MASLKTSGLRRLEEKILAKFLTKKEAEEQFFKKDNIPTSHASPSSTYGVGNSSNYGHLKLSDSITSTSGESSGVAATPAAVKAAADKSIIPQYACGTLCFTTQGGYDATSTYKVINFIPSIIKVYFISLTSSTGSDAQLCTVLTPPTAYGSSYTKVNTIWNGSKLVDGHIAEVSKGKTYYWRPAGSIGYYVYEIMGYKETS